MIFHMTTRTYLKLRIWVEIQVWNFRNVNMPFPLKCPFRSVFQNIQSAILFRSVGQKSQNFHQTLVLIVAFKFFSSEFTVVSLCLLLSCCKLYPVKQIGSFAARNFHDFWFLYFKFSEIINVSQNIWLIEN